MTGIERLKMSMGLFNGGPTKGPNKHHRKNGRGRRYKVVTRNCGPARDANQKTTFTKVFEITKNIHY